jgi:glycosyltransferase involved in cell wall biosynthesis
MMRARVLLSTYNGEAYLPELLDSVLGQDHEELELHVRDDGSEDGTWRILASYAANHPNVEIEAGVNLGVIQSFRALVDRPLGSVDYIALCDQDDIWDRDKISAALEILCRQDADVPLLYFGRTRLVDLSGGTVGLAPLPKRGPAFPNSLIENIVTGCTAVVNRRGVKLLRMSCWGHALMHDWWAYQVISGCGTVVYDPNPRIGYRQHGQNVVGAATGVSQWVSRLRRFPRREAGALMRQAHALAHDYGGILPPHHAEILSRFIRPRPHVQDRLRYAAAGEVWRQRAVDDAIFRLLAVLGRP